MRTVIKTAIVALGLVGLTLAPAFAAEFEIKMLNKGAAGAMVFEPAFVKIQPGDTVNFVPTDKGHDVESIKGMLPEGVEAFKGKISQPFTMTFDVPGAYGFKCTPHFAMGMIGMVFVGDDLANLDAAKAVKVPRKPQQRFDEIYAGAGL
ncbi:pseudoazurin [Devosia rhodophyticola]|uniref:Pseudoazurin n=1 Tax=Devosia rhodophyticola TaxID=3026423 RepID=A0ABY7YYN0_9HYPH|nr:pseudoazurin [Devosia rhodophyticola]WDR05994.1 pseudoazurin [Devosia rhodophyticola]